MARKPIDTTNMQQGQNQSYDMPASGPIDKSDFYDDFEIIETAQPKEAMAKEAFYEELVEVEILPTDKPNAEQVIPLCCNGVNQFLVRGIPTVVKRKFVEILARAKSEMITTPEYVDGNGDRATRILKTQGLRYPFRVLRDNNPIGREWLETVMRQGA